MPQVTEAQIRAYFDKCVEHWSGPGDPDDPWPKPPAGLGAYGAKEIQHAARIYVPVLRNYVGR